MHPICAFPLLGSLMIYQHCTQISNQTMKFILQGTIASKPRNKQMNYQT